MFTLGLGMYVSCQKPSGSEGSFQSHSFHPLVMFRCGDGIIYIPETLTCFGFGGVTDVRAMKDFVPLILCISSHSYCNLMMHD